MKTGKKIFFFFGIFFMIVILTYSCKEDEPEPKNNEDISQFDSSQIESEEKSEEEDPIFEPIEPKISKPAKPKDPKPKVPKPKVPKPKVPKPKVPKPKDPEPPKQQEIKVQNKDLKLGKYHQQNHPAAAAVFIEEDISLENIEYKITNATPKINFVYVSYKDLNTQLKSNTKGLINGVTKNIIINKDQQRLEDKDGPIINSNIVIDLDKINDIPTTRLEITTGDAGQILKMNRKKFGTENGICTFSAAIFLKKLEQNNNPMDLNPDDIIEEALKKYLELTPVAFRESRATRITETLEIIGLKVINKNPKEIQDKNSLKTEILKIKERSVVQNKMIRMDMKNGPESWAIVCIKGIFYLFDSHGKKNVGDEIVSFIKRFDDVNAFIDFCYDFSDIKHKIDSGEYVQLADSIYNYEVN